MKKTDKVIVAILSIWTFIHCYLILMAINLPEKIKMPYVVNGRFRVFYFVKTDFFYPFTTMEGGNTGIHSIGCYTYDIRYYDYTEFFVYVAGAWLCFLLYKLLSPKK